MMAVLPKILHILGRFKVVTVDNGKQLDKEWVELIKKALKMGISVEEIRQFLKGN